MKKLVVALMMGMGLLVLGAGCGKDEKAADGKAASGDSIGIAECDAYFKAVESCIAKNPAMKAAMEPSMKQNREAWKQAAQGPGKDTLKTTCKSATDAIAASCK
jgi:hypothetical protein